MAKQCFPLLFLTFFSVNNTHIDANTPRPRDAPCPTSRAPPQRKDPKERAELRPDGHINQKDKSRGASAPESTQYPWAFTGMMPILPLSQVPHQRATPRP